MLHKIQNQTKDLPFYYYCKRITRIWFMAGTKYAYGWDERASGIGPRRLGV
jgi:hypothetical protein